MIRCIALATLLLAGPVAAATCDAVWHDPTRGRDVPVRIRLPDGTAAVPVVLYSAGLGGDVNGGTAWASAWAAAGIATIHIQHPGSDSTLWAGKTAAADVVAALKTGMTAEQFFARIADIRFVLAAIPAHAADACGTARIDAARAGIAGHSFGAVTTQALAGQRFGGVPMFAEPRFKAALALSPSTPVQGTAADGFGAMALPFLSVTGSGDAVPELSDQSAASRTEPFAAMPPGGKYLLVFAGGDHLVFGGHAMRRAPLPADAHIRAVTARATTAFWQATLLGDAAARAYLAAGVKADLEPGERAEAK